MDTMKEGKVSCDELWADGLRAKWDGDYVWNGFLCPLIHADDVARIVETVNELWDGGDSPERLIVTRDESGAIVSVSSEFTYLDGDGCEVRPLEVFSDADGQWVEFGDLGWVWSEVTA